MKILKNTKDYYIIKKSDLFDDVWFKNYYKLSNDVNPIKYYLKCGIRKDLNPSKDFNTLWYLNEYEDVKKSGMHPFVHYIRHGRDEHRLPKPLFTQYHDKFSLLNQDYNPCFLNKSSDNISCDDVNIALILKNKVENLLPTEYIRVIIPIYHLFLEKNFTPYIFHGEEFIEMNEKKLQKFDVVIVQRDAIDKSTAINLKDICYYNNIKLIYEIDDYLLGIDRNHPNYDEFIRKKETIKYLISNSDIVIVSTNNLKEKLSHFNSNIIVVKNSFNDMLNLENNSFNSEIIKIGYMGTLTHKNDITIIENVIDNVKAYFSKKGKKVIFETVGVSAEKINCANPINIPFKYSKYPYFIRWLKSILDWDIALAPLQNNELNDSKSEIKYLEYTSLGIPGIYSDVGAYHDVIENYNNGILIENNSVEEWEYEIINLIENVDLQKNIVKNAKKDMINYSIDAMVSLFSKIFEKLLSKDKLLQFNKEPLKLLLNPIFNKEYSDIIESKLFDEDGYPNVYQDPIYHFLNKGVFKGYNPSREFNCKKYVEINNIDINEINPFIYFIRNQVYKFKFNSLTSKNIEDIYNNLEKKISIIIPIYDAFDETKRCIESVLKNSSNNCDIILINDKSTDSRINDLLKKYENYPNITIIQNTVNIGFVASVNLGLKNSDHDVILLNSDTIVTPKWIEKLVGAAYSDEKIATVTPFSNNAGVFSVPLMNKNNIIPKDLGLNGIANIVEKISNHEYIRVPTGNGFCMYIKREAINSIGYFDDKTFKRGYCEENDFCMRAIHNGWENIIDDSTYIFHKGSSSFSDEKNELINNHMSILNRKYPNYMGEVLKFVNSKNLRRIQCNIYHSIERDNFNFKRVLYISDVKENIIYDKNENYFLYVADKLILYYCGDGFLFKIKEWASRILDEVCFNIVINLGIDILYFEEKKFNLQKSIIYNLNKN